MYSDETGRELAAALQDNAAASRELAAVISAASAWLSPPAGMSYAELNALAEKQRLREPPAFDPNTHEGRVEAGVRKMLAIEHGESQ